MIDIEVSQETTNRLHAILSGLGKADEKVLKPAMQRGLIAGRTAFNKQIKSVYYVSPAVISRYSHIGYKKVEMRSDGLIGSIEYAGTVIPLIKYNVTPQKATYGKTPVKAAVKRSESQVELAKSFTAQMPNGHIGIYERKVTAVNEKGTHKYHCISQDGKGVYGWVNAESIKELSSKAHSDPASVSKGDIVTFTGGGVYKSSTAEYASVQKNVTSTCKVTAVNTKGTHPYHCISQDGKGVYGWVNAADVK